MKKSYTIKCPYEFFVGNKKRFANLNRILEIRNPFIRNNVKKEYGYICEDLIKDCPKFKGEVEVDFTFYYSYRKDITKLDKSNVYSIIFKYLYDSLTHAKKWEDDNDSIVKKETIYPTEYVQVKKGKLEKYALVTIREI
jgi:Holliday junction resolvase RusA-like endonuclease